MWDYPRPPAVVPDDRRVRIVCGGVTVVDTTDAVRVLETSHPPTWYVPFDAVRHATLRRADGASVCEFKGRAAYWDVVPDDGSPCAAAAWSYPRPARGYAELADRFTVYPGRVDACYVDREQVRAQPGGFYGGWITNDVAGPFKGAAGTLGW